MYSRIRSAANIGISGYLVDVEVYISNGLPRFKIVGLPDKSVGEAKERVTAAIRSSSYTFPLKKITVNLAPSNIPKHGPYFDLPIAIGILHASGQINSNSKITTINPTICGELGLDGRLKHTRATPILVQAAYEHNQKMIIIPSSSYQTESFPSKIKVKVANNLTSCVNYLNGKNELDNFQQQSVNTTTTQNSLKFHEISGNSGAKRAGIITAAGQHNLALTGPPGCGKTLLSRSLSNILPTLTSSELFEIHKIYSLTNKRPPLARPFRDPHHTSSTASMIGGGSTPIPGEISLAHKGILFLDEFAEFSPHVINSLRQPIEDGYVNISRGQTRVRFPADYILVTSMNPCPCGYLDHPKKTCTCKPAEIRRYRNKVPNAIWDRIDLSINLLPQKFENLNRSTKKENESYYTDIIDHAWKIQQKRGRINSKVQLCEKDTICNMTRSANLLLKKAYQSIGMSTRGLLQTIRVSRTIADVEDSTLINEEHIAEAISYRKT